MDREISAKEKQKIRLLRIGKIVAAFALLTGIIVAGINYSRSKVNEKRLTFCTIDRGTIETSVTASGEVHPAFEEIINYPIALYAQMLWNSDRSIEDIMFETANMTDIEFV